MKVVVDEGAGFCRGVTRAIKLIEEELDRDGEIYVRGELIHNRLEMNRLHQKGLMVTEELEPIKNKRLFIRTHGEGKEIFEQASRLGIQVTNATCPLVKRSQRIVDQAFIKGYQIVIVGKREHPEVKGLLSYCHGQGMVVLKPSDLEIVNIRKKTLLIAQTTVSPAIFHRIRRLMEKRVGDLKIYNTICGFVGEREKSLRQFARCCDTIVFIGGKNSSNTRFLYKACRSANPSSYFVEDVDEIRDEWFGDSQSVGISGSASTPMWQIMRAKEYIRQIKPNRG